MKKSKTITIVGGSGSMGQLFAKYWQQLNFKVQILDKNNLAETEILIKNSDLVVISVPINITQQTISNVSQYLNKSTILIDFTSIKEPILKHMISVHAGPILSMHPMFGPTIVSPKAQVIINCGGQQEELARWVIKSLLEIGFSIKNMSALDHDDTMGFIQGIEHFSTFALGSFLKRKGQHPDHLFSIASPIYQAKLALLGRIFDQSPDLYADILMDSAKRIDLIDQYANWLKSWANKLKNNDRQEFIQEFIEVSQWMGDFTSKAQLASDHFLTEVNKQYQTNPS